MSGAQRAIAAILLYAVLRRARGNLLGDADGGISMIFDNPFGNLSDASLLKSLMVIVKKMNLHLFFFTHVEDPNIACCFENVIGIRKLVCSSHGEQHVVEQRVDISGSYSSSAESANE